MFLKTIYSGIYLDFIQFCELICNGFTVFWGNNSFNNSSSPTFVWNTTTTFVFHWYIFSFLKSLSRGELSFNKGLFYNEYPVDDYVLTISNSAYVLSFEDLEIYLLSFWKVHLLVLEGHMSLTVGVYLFLLSLNFFLFWHLNYAFTFKLLWVLISSEASWLCFCYCCYKFVPAHSILGIIFEPILNSLPLIFK